MASVFLVRRAAGIQQHGRWRQPSSVLISFPRPESPLLRRRPAAAWPLGLIAAMATVPAFAGAAESPPCQPVAQLEGRADVVAPIDHVLQTRGISSAGAANPCQPVAVTVRPAGRGYALVILDREGRTARRLLPSVEAAALVIESWTRADLAAPLVDRKCTEACRARGAGAAPSSERAAGAGPGAVGRGPDRQADGNLLHQHGGARQPAGPRHLVRRRDGAGPGRCERRDRQRHCAGSGDRHGFLRDGFLAGRDQHRASVVHRPGAGAPGFVSGPGRCVWACSAATRAPWPVPPLRRRRQPARSTCSWPSSCRCG